MQVVASDDTFVRVNDAFCEFVGRAAEKLVGANRSNVVHPLDHDHDDPVIGRRMYDEGPARGRRARDRRKQLHG